MKEQWCLEKIDAPFIANMEDILDIYERPYDPKIPVVCFDERPCQLIDDVVQPVLPSSGRVAREDYHYKRNGTCNVMLAIEPLTGKRTVKICEYKKKADYASFMTDLTKAYPGVDKIILVQDNLNTHSPSAFYASFPPEKAFDLMRNVEMHFTPKRASWLNMVEIEFAAMSKQCLDRRIGNMKCLAHEVGIWIKDRIRKKIKIDWQFSVKDARKKFAKPYNNIKNN